MAYQSVAVYGMNEKVGLVSFPQDSQRFDKPYSDETARMIDEEARNIIKECYDITLKMLRDKTDVVESLAQVLCCSDCYFAPVSEYSRPVASVGCFLGMFRCGL